MSESIPVLSSLFAGITGTQLLLRPDAPRFTILAVSDEYLQVSGRTRNDLLHKGLFEAFPNNPVDPLKTSEAAVRTSLETTLLQKAPHSLPVQRYDVATSDNQYEEQYWSIQNSPVLDADGHVVYLLHSVSDLTEKIKLETKTEQLRNLEKGFGLFMHGPMVAALVKGPDLVVEFANEEALGLWGKGPAIIGQSLRTFLPEAKHGDTIQALETVLQTGLPYQAKEVPVDTGGQQRYFNVRYQPYVEENRSGPAGVFMLSYEVTEMVTAKAAAEKQQRLYETVTSNTPDLIYVFDLDYRFTYANKALLNMWGSTWEAAIGKGLRENGYEEWHALMHEREIDQVAATGESVRGEVSFPHATLGRRIYDYILVPVFNEKGVVEVVAGTTRDITEIRLAEQTIRESNDRFRNLADESPLFIFIIEADPTATVSYWNKTWLTYTGQSEEAALGNAWNQVIHPEDVPLVLATYTPAFEQQTAYYLPALRVRRHDGEYRWHAFKGNPRYSVTGGFDGFVGVGLDIHDQKLAEEALKQSEEQLQRSVAERTVELERTVEELRRSNSNLEEFAYAASHDLKEPIRKIHFFGERLKATLGDRLVPEEQRYFERMEGASKRMASLIDDLLSYSQVSIRPRSFEAVDLNRLLTLVLEDLDLEIEQKGARIQLDRLFTIQGHHRQLQQTFQNLLSNALKYNQPGVAPQIAITCSQVKGADTPLHLSPEERQRLFYCITVKDNGIGFAQADAERIFNVFTRLHGMTEYKGTGIGLSIVRKVIENHKGYIWAEAKPGEGASFYILFPVPAEVPGAS